MRARPSRVARATSPYPPHPLHPLPYPHAHRPHAPDRAPVRRRGRPCACPVPFVVSHPPFVVSLSNHGRRASLAAAGAGCALPAIRSGAPPNPYLQRAPDSFRAPLARRSFLSATPRFQSAPTERPQAAPPSPTAVSIKRVQAAPIFVRNECQSWTTPPQAQRSRKKREKRKRLESNPPRLDSAGRTPLQSPAVSPHPATLVFLKTSSGG